MNLKAAGHEKFAILRITKRVLLWSAFHQIWKSQRSFREGFSILGVRAIPRHASQFLRILASPTHDLPGPCIALRCLWGVWMSHGLVYLGSIVEYASRMRQDIASLWGSNHIRAWIQRKSGKRVGLTSL